MSDVIVFEAWPSRSCIHLRRPLRAAVDFSIDAPTRIEVRRGTKSGVPCFAAGAQPPPWHIASSTQTSFRVSIPLAGLHRMVARPIPGEAGISLVSMPDVQ
jgi:hypothetical protein